MSGAIDLRSALSEWTDFDGAEFEVARCLGIIEPTSSWSPTVHKGLFWSNNPVGNGLGKILDALVAMGAVEMNEDHQYRWNQSFNPDRAVVGTEPRCVCGEDDGSGPTLPHKTWCPAGLP